MRWIILVICLVFISGCTEKQRTGPDLNEQETATGSNQEDTVSEQEINDTVLEIAQKDSSVSSFISEYNYSYEITVLDEKTIEPLAEKYPVIYDGLPEKPLYRIEYQNGKGLLVIVDLENETVLRSFRTTGVTLQ